MEIVKHIKHWNKWRKRNLNSKLHKFLVLIGIVHSPTYEATYDCDRYSKMWENIFK